jgi:hypothetical protein
MSGCDRGIGVGIWVIYMTIDESREEASHDRGLVEYTGRFLFSPIRFVSTFESWIHEF